MNILVLGVGNEILTDDGVGPRIAEGAQQRWFGTGVRFQTTFQAGMPLVDLVTGSDVLIIIDAIRTGGRPGELYWLDPEDMPCGDGASVPEHKIGILKALKLGRALGLAMPERVFVLAVEAADVTTFGEELTPEVAASVPGAIRQVLNKLTEITRYPEAVRKEALSFPPERKE